LVYYDQRGSGRSDDNSAPTAAEHVADLEALRVELGEEQLVLLGYSWGALLAMLYALEHPTRVARLALLSPAPAASAERPAMKTRLAAAGQRPEVAELRRRLGPLDRRSRFALAVAGYFVDPSLALNLTPFIVKQKVEESVWKSLGEYDLRPRLSTLSIPSLVAHGEEDPIPVETARATAEALRARFVTFPRCGHCPYVEAQAACLQTLDSFLVV
jgi:proline iminopeptidase